MVQRRPPAPRGRGSRQPGWEGGVLQRPSWSIEYDAEDFASCVKHLQQAGVPLRLPQPECHGSYWAFPVLDPMGSRWSQCYSWARTPWPQACPGRVKLSPHGGTCRLAGFVC
jgi:hypothetical protein